MANLSRKQRRIKRHLRIRNKVLGTSSIPRMSVCVTGKHLYIQFIDDLTGKTLVSASSVDKNLRSEKIAGNRQGAEKLGKVAAERALEAGINSVVFDRGGFKFHGRVKTIADAAREAGLKF